MPHTVDLDLQPHAASGLAPCSAEAVRVGLGLDPAYWTVLDDGAVERCIALIGRATAADGRAGGDWHSACLDARPSAAADRTHGARALAVHDGWVHVFGSGRGGGKVALDRARSFVARFHESDVRLDEDGAVRAELQVAAEPFVLHRLLNDALVQAGTPLFAYSPRYLERSVHRARRKAIDKGRRWAWRIGWDDVPIDIAGAAFTGEGHLLLGLRTPPTRHGEPIVVELRHPARLFDGGAAEPLAGRVFVLRGIGDRRAPVGIRDLHVDAGNRVLHALVGSLGTAPDDAALLAEHPEGALAESVHVRATLPGAPRTSRAKAARALTPLVARPVHRFEGLRRVEGIALGGTPDGGPGGEPAPGGAPWQGRHFLYVSDEDGVARIRFSKA